MKWKRTLYSLFSAFAVCSGEVFYTHVPDLVQVYAPEEKGGICRAVGVFRDGSIKQMFFLGDSVVVGEEYSYRSQVFEPEIEAVLKKRASSFRAFLGGNLNFVYIYPDGCEECVGVSVRLKSIGNGLSVRYSDSKIECFGSDLRTIVCPDGVFYLRKAASRRLSGEVYLFLSDGRIYVDDSAYRYACGNFLKPPAGFGEFPLERRDTSSPAPGLFRYKQEVGNAQN